MSTAPHAVVGVAGGLSQIRATLRGMVALVRTYRGHPVLRTLAVQLVQGCAPRDQLCELTQLQHFVRDRIRYTLDVHGMETLQTPIVTLGYKELAPPSVSGGVKTWGQVEPGGTPAGDCDDKAVLLASLMLCVGIPGRFCAIGQNGPNTLSHVLVQARLRTRSQIVHYPLESILPGVEPGWFPPNIHCFMVANFG